MSRAFRLIDRRTGEVTFDGVELARQPCPICGHKGWCLRDHGRGMTICPRTPGAREIGDAGWLYFDSGAEPEKQERIFRASKPEPRPVVDFTAENLRFQCALVPIASAAAKSFGVSKGTMKRLGMGWCVDKQCFSWPMFSEAGRCIGLRLRTLDGFKFAATGSHNGLFISQGLRGEGDLYIEEGPTSTAAVLDMGLDCIGRPSCSACVDMTVDWVMMHGRGARRTVVIIANRDTAKKRPDGSEFYPGQEGAAKLAAALAPHARQVKIIMPTKGKDSRDWAKAGATAKTIQELASYTSAWRAA